MHVCEHRKRNSHSNESFNFNRTVQIYPSIIKGILWGHVYYNIKWQLFGCYRPQFAATTPSDICNKDVEPVIEKIIIEVNLEAKGMIGVWSGKRVEKKNIFYFIWNSNFVNINKILLTNLFLILIILKII